MEGAAPHTYKGLTLYGTFTKSRLLTTNVKLIYEMPLSLSKKKKKGLMGIPPMSMRKRVEYFYIICDTACYSEGSLTSCTIFDHY